MAKYEMLLGAEGSSDVILYSREIKSGDSFKIRPLYREEPGESLYLRCNGQQFEWIRVKPNSDPVVNDLTPTYVTWRSAISFLRHRVIIDEVDFYNSH